ncbi:c-type cytochrome [Mesorhizobium sp. A623]
MMRIHWKHIAITLAILPIAGLIFAWIGFFNVGASSGHWKITDWFLHFAMRSAVRTYALAVDPPERLPNESIQPAAGHYARGCAICHGAPGEPRTQVMMRMLPQPPDLRGKVSEWNDAELYRIVMHGIRFTGMPAWPTQDRGDEVWAMVAFLRDLPSMDAAQYRNLAYGGEPPELHPTTLDAAITECSRCHGADGVGRSPMTPLLTGQSEAYLLESLRAYVDERRASGIMGVASDAVDPALLPELARYFAALPPTLGVATGADDESRGAEIARAGIPRDGVPACLGCHGMEKANPLYPRIARQKAEYIASQLHLFRSGTRGGTPFHHLMANAAKGLTDADITALADYFSALPISPATEVDGRR